MDSDERPPETSPKPGWLQRQWNRLRGKSRAGDTILAEVGEDARHVVVGKNIIQIGSIAIPIWLVVLIAVAVVIGAGVAIADTITTRRQLGDIGDVVLAPTATPTPTAIPTPTPTPVVMSGTLFNIAVTEFAEMDAEGNLQPSSLGAELSRLLFTGLRNTDLSQLPFLVQDDLSIWHLADNQAERQIEQAILVGQTSEMRGAEAEALARHTHAQMIVSGYLRVADDPGSLVLEFFFRPDQQWLRDQPDAIGGRHELGRPINFPAGTALNPDVVKLIMTEPLRFRAQILAWLSLGLAFDVRGDPDLALDIFHAAEDELQAWRRTDGKELLYYLQGRSALYLRRYDEAATAFQTALDINPGYANALMGMGSIHFDRAQLYYLRDRPIPQGVDQCIDVEDVAAAPETAAEAQAEIERALDYFERALEAAPAAPWPPIAAIAQLNLGLGHWLHGQALGFEEEATLAETEFAQAVNHFQQTIEPFSGVEQVELLGHTYLGLGVTHFAWGNLLARQQETPDGTEHFIEAFSHLNRCVDLENAPDATEFLRHQIIECGCRPYQQEAEQAVIDRGGGEG